MFQPYPRTLIDRANQLSQGLAGCWPLNEGAGGLVYDATGKNPSPGVLTNFSATPWVGGPLGARVGLQFDGTNDFITFGNILNFERTDSFSIFILFAVAVADPASNMILVRKKDATVPGYTFQIRGDLANNPVDLQLRGSSGSQFCTVRSDQTWVADQWTSLLWTNDGSSTAAGQLLYRDGVLQTVATIDDTLTSESIITPSALAMGAQASSAASPLAAKGGILRFYNRVLIPDEARQLGVDSYAGFKRQSKKSYSVLYPFVRFDAAFSSGDIAAASSWSGLVPWNGNNRGLAVDVTMLGPGVNVTAMTYGGANCTFIGSRSSVTSFGAVEQWRIIQSDPGAPAAGANTLAVTLSGAIEFAVIGESVTGVHQVSPTEGFNSAQATNGAGAADASVAVTSVADNCLVHAAVVASDTSIAANQTTRNNVSGTLGSGADEDSGIVTPAGATMMSYTGVGAFVTWVITGYAWRPTTAASLGGSIIPIVDRLYRTRWAA